LPISFGNGYKSHGFCETIKYNVTSGGTVPVQSGKILSIGKPASDSGLSTDTPGDAVTHTANEANKGIQTDEGHYFESNSVPFWWQLTSRPMHQSARST